jgi:hypothetical protein
VCGFLGKAPCSVFPSLLLQALSFLSQRGFYKAGSEEGMRIRPSKHISRNREVCLNPTEQKSELFLTLTYVIVALSVIKIFFFFFSYPNVGSPFIP